MSDINGQSGAAPVQPTPAPVKRGFFRSRWLVAGALVLTGLVGFGVGKASSFRGHHGGWGGYGMSRGMDSSQMNNRAERGINRVLSGVDATAEQKTKVTALVQAAMAEMQPLRQSFREGRDKLAAALKATVVDRNAIETLRAEQLQKAEAMSKKMQDTLLSVADILTPAQRAQLVDRWQTRGWNSRRGQG